MVVIYARPVSIYDKMITIRMGCKFRLCHKKRYYYANSLQGVTSLPVSIPLEKVQVYPYPVSIPYPLSFSLSWPHALFTSSPVDNLDGLHRRISKAEIAPAGKFELSFDVNFILKIILCTYI